MVNVYQKFYVTGEFHSVKCANFLCELNVLILSGKQMMNNAAYKRVFVDNHHCKIMQFSIVQQGKQL